jgi:hypothetical protein
MFEGTWTKVSTIEFAKLLCATLLALGPRLLDFDGAPAWNAKCASFAIFFMCLAGLPTHAEWKERANLVLGGWLVLSPWVLNFSNYGSAAGFHVVIGTAICLLSVAKLWDSPGNPPWLYGPGAAARAALSRPPSPETDYRAAEISRNAWLTGFARSKYRRWDGRSQARRRDLGHRRLSGNGKRASYPRARDVRAGPGSFRAACAG